MNRRLEFYKTSKEGAVALTELAKRNGKARLLIDWISMILVNRGSTSNAIMVSNEVLQEVMGCSTNTVSKAIKDANSVGVLGVARVHNSRVYYINPKAIKMDTVDDKYYAFDVAIVLDKDDAIFQSIGCRDTCTTSGLPKNGSVGSMPK